MPIKKQPAAKAKPRRVIHSLAKDIHLERMADDNLNRGLLRRAAKKGAR